MSEESFRFSAASRLIFSLTHPPRHSNEGLVSKVKQINFSGYLNGNAIELSAVAKIILKLLLFQLAKGASGEFFCIMCN